MKILFDLFPVILFFGVFKLAGGNPDATQAFAAAIGYQADPLHLPVLAATATAIIATMAQIVWVKFRHGKVDTMLWVSFAIILFFWRRDPAAARRVFHQGKTYRPILAVCAGAAVFKYSVQKESDTQPDGGKNEPAGSHMGQAESGMERILHCSRRIESVRGMELFHRYMGQL
jgi:hypothetical protein